VGFVDSLISSCKTYLRRKAARDANKADDRVTANIFFVEEEKIFEVNREGRFYCFVEMMNEKAKGEGVSFGWSMLLSSLR
jgi:hypothetical protein